MAKAFFSGNLTRDPEVFKSDKSGKSVLRLSVADNSAGKDKTMFLDCVVFDAESNPTAKFISQYFKKGKPIEITAKFQPNEYAAKDGTKVKGFQFVVLDASFVPGGAQNGEANGHGAAPAKTTGKPATTAATTKTPFDVDDDEDIPL